ncbi:MAG: family 1 glycosylhydrolase [bacterium]
MPSRPNLAVARATSVLVVALALGCGSDHGDADGAIRLPKSFVLGAATAAQQVEGGLTNTDWYQFTTLPEFAGKTAEPAGAAASSYELYDTDHQLVEDMGLDAYRFSIDWSRVMPRKGVFDEREIAHYRAVLDSVRAHGLAPYVTLHHFTNPIWVYDLTDLGCDGGPTDTNLCGWSNPEVAAQFALFCGRMAAELGGQVDWWATFNEPNVYFLSGYTGGSFPPGLFAPLPSDISGSFSKVLDRYLSAHAQCYDAIRANDTIDADHDGAAARVGLTIATTAYEPADPADPKHVAAAEASGAPDYSFVNGVVAGGLDRDLDGVIDEDRPAYRDKLDWLGLQYYREAKVLPLLAKYPLSSVPCEDEITAFVGPLGPLLLDLLGCPRAPYPDFPIPNYTGPGPYHWGGVHAPEALLDVTRLWADRFPTTPLLITENGYGVREGDFAIGGNLRAQSLVRHLAVVRQILDSGIDLRGYFHWSLIDNFEWAQGFGIRFGLYTLDRETFARTPTEAAAVLSEIAHTRRISRELLDTYGGTGALRR